MKNKFKKGDKVKITGSRHLNFEQEKGYNYVIVGMSVHNQDCYNVERIPTIKNNPKYYRATNYIHKDDMELAKTKKLTNEDIYKLNG